LKKMLKYHSDKQAYATVALASGFAVRVGLADLENNGKIRGFVEKPKLEKPVSIGIIALEGEALKDIEQLHKNKRQVDLMKDLIPHLIENGKPVYGYLSKAFWYDVGSTEAYEKLDHGFVDKSFSHLFK
jgi:mannose-1-phosphate guanylyltransferase